MGLFAEIAISPIVPNRISRHVSTKTCVPRFAMMAGRANPPPRDATAPGRRASGYETSDN